MARSRSKRCGSRGRAIRRSWPLVVAALVGCGGRTSDGSVDAAGQGGSPSDAAVGSSSMGGSTVIGSSTGGTSAGGTASGGAASGGAASGGAASGGAASECIQSAGQGGCGELACADGNVGGKALPACCGAPEPGASKGCCGFDMSALPPAVRQNFGLPPCVSSTAFEAPVNDASDPLCSPACDPSCPGIDVGTVWGLPGAKLVGCCRADGTCGGTTASLPKLALSKFPGSAQCLSVDELNAVFANAPYPWTLPVVTPTACSGN